MADECIVVDLDVVDRFTPTLERYLLRLALDEALRPSARLALTAEPHGAAEWKAAHRRHPDYWIEGTVAWCEGSTPACEVDGESAAWPCPGLLAELGLDEESYYRRARIEVFAADARWATAEREAEQRFGKAPF